MGAILSKNAAVCLVWFAVRLAMGSPKIGAMAPSTSGPARSPRQEESTCSWRESRREARLRNDPDGVDLVPTRDDLGAEIDPNLADRVAGVRRRGRDVGTSADADRCDLVDHRVAEPRRDGHLLH